MKSGITYAPELVGENPRLIAEREFLKLQAVIAELAESTAQQNARLSEIEGLVGQHEVRLEALENPE